MEMNAVEQLVDNSRAIQAIENRLSDNSDFFNFCTALGLPQIGRAHV
jgi:hypothetical protein